MNTTPSPEAPTAAPDAPIPPDVPVVRSLGGGVLMGLANLVPGISGGTMILAVGLYDRFIGAVADVTRLRLERRSIAFLGLVAFGLAAAVVGLSGVAVRLVADHRWVMYALFVGMTLGGVPDLARLARPVRPGVVAAVLLGVGAMALFAFGLRGTRLPDTLPVLFLVGVAGASSMILPGISGSYVLLVLGMYDLVIGALSASALRAAPLESLRVVGPVVVGAVLGIALLSNVLKSLLERFSRASHAALLGLLVGSVVGLWPFQDAVHPELVHPPTRAAIEEVVLEGADVEAARAAHGLASDVPLAEHAEAWEGRTRGELKAASQELRVFAPALDQVLGALGLLGLGFAITRLLGRAD